jgi:hypothetical protein
VDIDHRPWRPDGVSREGHCVVVGLKKTKDQAAALPQAFTEMLRLAAVGYSGADFIEGFVSRYLPSGAIQAAAPQLAAATPLPGPPAPLPAPRPMTPLAHDPAPVTPLSPPVPSGPAPIGG